jgi:hypothetical protein
MSHLASVAVPDRSHLCSIETWAPSAVTWQAGKTSLLCGTFTALTGGGASGPGVVLVMQLQSSPMRVQCACARRAFAGSVRVPCRRLITPEGITYIG